MEWLKAYAPGKVLGQVDRYVCRDGHIAIGASCGLRVAQLGKPLHWLTIDDTSPSQI